MPFPDLADDCTPTLSVDLESGGSGQEDRALALVVGQLGRSPVGGGRFGRQLVGLHQIGGQRQDAGKPLGVSQAGVQRDRPPL